MSCLISWDSSRARPEIGPCKSSMDNVDEPARWYFSRREIEENSPSRRDGIDLKKETYFRKSYCTFLQDLGMRLKVPQITIATAIIFCHRFFIRQSHAKNDRRTIATVCMFLAGKVEETPRPLKDVILVSYEIINKKDPSASQRIKQKEVYEQQKELILLGERLVLATLGFDLNVLQPYKPLVEALKKFQVARSALAQVAWNFVNDGLRTSLCLQFKPHHIAAGAIFLAAKFLKVKLPSDGEKVWWQEFDVTPRQLEEVSNQMLELYEQNSVPPSQGSEADGTAGSAHPGPAKTCVLTFENASKHLVARTVQDRPHQKHHDAPTTGAQNAGNGNSEGDSIVTDHRADARASEDARSSWEHPVKAKSAGSAREEQAAEGGHDQARNEGASEAAAAAAAWERRDREDGAAHKPNVAGRGADHLEGSVSRSPRDGGIRMIDKDKLKAALEKRRKSRVETTRRDLVDDDDLIERALEDGVELAAEDDKLGRERKHISVGSGPAGRLIDDDDHLHFSRKMQHPSQGLEADRDNAEEGEMVDELAPTVNQKRKGRSPQQQTQSDAKKRNLGAPISRNEPEEDLAKTGCHFYS